MEASERKKYRDRANRAYRSLLREKSQHGFIDDGAGKRYQVGVYYLLSGEVEKALAFYSWFEQEFPDDIGEPVFELYWALAHYRDGNMEAARARLQGTMLQNIYLLPFLFDEPLAKQNIWHSSNWTQPEYLCEIEMFLNEPTVEERHWIKREFHSGPFEALRTGYIETYGALLGEKDFQRRGKILNDWRQFSQKFFEKE